jgi:hypothetical protein
MRTMRSLALPLCATVLAACGGGGSTGPVTGAGAGGPRGTADAAAGGGVANASPNSAASGATSLSGTVNLSGPAAVSGPFTSTTAPLPCATLGQAGSSGRFPLPSPGDVGGQQVQISLTVSPYTGPGAYGPDHLRSTGAGLTVAGRRYSLDGASMVSVSIEPDASGRLQLSGLGTASGPPLSGTVTWTCRASQVGSKPSAQPSGQP